MKEGTLFFYLILFVLVSVSMILILSSNNKQDNGMKPLRKGNISEWAPKDLAKLKPGQRLTINKDSILVSSKTGSVMSLNRIEMDRESYWCSFSILNQTSRANQYVMHMSVQESRKNREFTDIYHIADLNAGYIDASLQRTFSQAFPVFARNTKRQYRVYFQLLNNINNSQQFICDGAMLF